MVAGSLRNRDLPYLGAGGSIIQLASVIMIGWISAAVLFKPLHASSGTNGKNPVDLWCKSQNQTI